MSRLAEHLTARLDAMELDLAELRAELARPPEVENLDAGISVQVEALTLRLAALSTRTEERLDALSTRLRGRLRELEIRLDAAEDVARTLTARAALLDAAPPRRRVAELAPPGRGKGGRRG